MLSVQQILHKPVTVTLSQRSSSLPQHVATEIRPKIRNFLFELLTDRQTDRQTERDRQTDTAEFRPKDMR